MYLSVTIDERKASRPIMIAPRQVIEADHGQVFDNLAVAVDAQGKTAGEVLLGRGQFLGRGPLRDKTAQGGVEPCLEKACADQPMQPIPPVHQGPQG